MNVSPTYSSVGNFFKREPMFRVPKYQRSYAWEKQEIQHFLSDVEKCYNNRNTGNSKNHFFGGIVSVELEVLGVPNQKKYELVDGQQRFATFVMSMAGLIQVYNELLSVAKSSNDMASERIIERRVEKIKKEFIEFEQEINRQTKTVHVLNLSNADDNYFRELINGNSPTVERESHSRLSFAYNQIKNKLEGLCLLGSMTDKLDNLERFQNVFAIDFSILHIVTKDKNEAFTLFQILNNRGKNLTEGDLLRAKTLELLEDFQTKQDTVEGKWNSILKDTSKKTDNYLRWIYASNVGKRAGVNTLFEDYLTHFYTQSSNSMINENDAQAIVAQTKNIAEEVALCRLMSEGLWPFTSNQPITHWDRNRLSLLTKELGLKITMPLLLAAYELGESKFSELVQMLERFLFRYKIIGNKHIGKVQKVIQDEAIIIRNNPNSYNITNIKSKFSALISSEIPDNVFEAQLRTLEYKVGGGNKPLKYLLMTCEHYYRWYIGGANGSPKCMDKSRVYDFGDTTIEHIYPRRASGSISNSVLEPFKNSLGNLTFMGPMDNNSGGNNDFHVKKPIFEVSSVSLNKKIAAGSVWGITEVDNWADFIIEMSKKIFIV